MEDREFFKWIYRFILMVFMMYSGIAWCNGTINAYYWSQGSLFLTFIGTVLIGIFARLSLIGDF